MRTEVAVHAVVGAPARVRATGGMAVRHTGSGSVHLVGTAATPLGGDEIRIAVVVDAGARLRLRSVAATIALPGYRTPISVTHWDIEVGAGGVLDVDPEPTVIAGGADHLSHTRIRLAEDARLLLRERVQIGRTDEDRGRWTGDLSADRETVPLLRHRLELGAGAVTDNGLAAPRALVSELRYPDDRAAAVAGVAAARLPLAAGGSLYTWTGTVLADAPSVAGLA